MLFTLHLAAVVLAALALWLTRHELRETAATRLDWAAPTALAIAVAAILLIVSPGKRFAFWVVVIGAGWLLGVIAGLLMGWLLKIEKDVAHELMRMSRVWDGIAASGLLFFLAAMRFVTTDLLGRQSVGFGVLGALAALAAAYLLARLVTLQIFAAMRAPYANMERGEALRPS
jgi:hypothetical protein